MSFLPVIVLVAAVFTRPMERVSTMDPAATRSIYDSHAIQLVYETPLEIDYEARPYRLVPGFCEMPRVSSDGLVYTFPLRHREGSVLGAADMVRSLERLRDPAVVSPNGWIMKDIDTVREVAGGVEIRLKRRCHFFPWLMAMTACAVRGNDGSGSGPYELSAWRKNHEMRFRAKPGRCRPHGFDEVRYLVIDDASTQWLMFLGGELDYLGEISRDNFDAVVGPGGRLDPSLAARGITLHSYPSLDVLHVGFNMRDPVVGRNRRLRQALSAAFDYPAWERFYNGRILPLGGPVPPGVDGGIDRPSEYSFDLVKARRLIADAGYPGGIDAATGRRLVLTLSIGRASQASREQGELMASFFERIGVKLELSFMTWDAFLRAVNDGRVQLFSMGWVGDYPDAQNFLQLFHSSNVSPGPNHSYYVNPEYDREYDAALAAESVEERNRRWIRCQEIVREDCPWIFTHCNKAYSLTGPRVGNFVPGVFSYGVERHYENTVP